jgi:hypothetical protein
MYHNISGSIDEVAIYDRALSASEIQEQYNNGMAGKDMCGNEYALAPVCGNSVIES